MSLVSAMDLGVKGPRGDLFVVRPRKVRRAKKKIEDGTLDGALPFSIAAARLAVAACKICSCGCELVLKDGSLQCSVGLSPTKYDPRTGKELV